MLNEAKLRTGITDKAYEPDLCMLIEAALTEMKTRGIEFEGSFRYETGILTAEEAEEAGEPEMEGMMVVTDWECDIRDRWVRHVALLYVQANARGCENPDRLMAVFENEREKMAGTTGYHRGWEA